jgi:hypothetical protein
MTILDPPSVMSGARFVAQRLSAPERIEWAIREIEANLKERPGIVFDFAKSLIETTCKTIFKEMGQRADESWSVQQLAGFTLKAVVRAPAGHPNPEVAKARLETCLKGLVGVVHGLGELRNLDGEIGHGLETDRITLGSCHAEFAARAADSVVKFLMESHRNAQSVDGVPTALSYYENPEFNDYLDELHPPSGILGGEYKSSEILFQMDPQIYKDALDDFLDERAQEAEADPT